MRSHKSFKTEQPIDWNKKQLLVAKKSGSVVVSDGQHTEDTFSGTFIYTDPKSGRTIGSQDGSLSKECFEIYDGTITLEN